MCKFTAGGKATTHVNIQTSQEKYVVSIPVVLNLFWPMDHLFEKYPMDPFAMLTPHE